jgi:hypothetical protein
MRKLLGIIVLMSVAVPGLAQPRKVKPGFNLFSKEQDVQLGREAAAQIERQVQVVGNPELQNYVSRIGQKLASSPDAGGYPYTFKVVNDPSINAFALPGGPAYVHTGLIRAADNEAQLAGVLAHEIAHVALRHGTNQASKANLIQLPALLAGAVMGNGSMLGQLAQLGIGLGANSVLLKFSRDAERDADILGARLMAQAGYNPIEMARFFEKLEAEGGSRGPQFLSDHPNPGNRVKYVQEEIRYLPQRSYSADTGDLPRAKSLVGGLPPPPKRSAQAAPGQAPSGEEPRGGPAPSIRPSSSYRQYQGREFSISYPENWQTFGDSGSAMLTIAPREGIVEGSRGVSIGYGAMISYYSPQGNRVDLRQDTADLIRQLQQSNPSMEVRRNATRNVNVGGSRALMTTLHSASPYNGTIEVDTLVTVARPEGLFYIILIAPESEFNQVQGAFEQMLRSVRFR